MPVTFTESCFDPDAPTDPELDPDDDDVDPTAWTGHHPGGWEAEPRFRVVTSTVELAADALLVAAGRFMRVGLSGTEHGEHEPAADDRTPSISSVSTDSEAAYIYADTSEWLSHEMASTMKRILVEELERAGLAAVISEDYDPVRGVHAEPWPREQGRP